MKLAGKSGHVQKAVDSYIIMAVDVQSEGLSCKKNSMALCPPGAAAIAGRHRLDDDSKIVRVSDSFEHAFASGIPSDVVQVIMYVLPIGRGEI